MTTACNVGGVYRISRPVGDTNWTVVNGFRIVSLGIVNSSKLAALSTPVQWTGVPIAACSSHTRVENPACERRQAAYRPAGPPPITSTSKLIRKPL